MIEAAHRVPGFVSNTILTTIVRGIANNIPIAPNNHPQNNNEIKIKRGDNPSPFPMNFGSMILPITVLITR